jgi:hypothetical protein
VNPTRRRFLAAGVLGAGTLAVAGWLHFASVPRDSRRKVLDARAETIVGALVPALLDGALPGDAGERREAIEETVAGVDLAIAGLPPHAQSELAQLFALLAWPPVRMALLRSTDSWRDATTTDIEGFLERARTSRSMLMRSAYDAIHQLVLAAWYGNPRAWPAIGYAGPPRLA